MSRIPEYVAWCAMKERCLNPNVAYYHNYGGRGIKIETHPLRLRNTR